MVVTSYAVNIDFSYYLTVRASSQSYIVASLLFSVSILLKCFKTQEIGTRLSCYLWSTSSTMLKVSRPLIFGVGDPSLPDHSQIHFSKTRW